MVPRRQGISTCHGASALDGLMCSERSDSSHRHFHRFFSQIGRRSIQGGVFAIFSLLEFGIELIPGFIVGSFEKCRRYPCACSCKYLQRQFNVFYAALTHRFPSDCRHAVPLLYSGVPEPLSAFACGLIGIATVVSDGVEPHAPSGSGFTARRRTTPALLALTILLLRQLG